MKINNVTFWEDKIKYFRLLLMSVQRSIFF